MSAAARKSHAVEPRTLVGPRSYGSEVHPCHTDRTADTQVAHLDSQLGRRRSHATHEAYVPSIRHGVPVADTPEPMRGRRSRSAVTPADRPVSGGAAMDQCDATSVTHLAGTNL